MPPKKKGKGKKGKKKGKKKNGMYINDVKSIGTIDVEDVLTQLNKFTFLGAEFDRLGNEQSVKC